MASFAVVIASPLYTAPATLESCSALVPSAPLHPSMLPASDAKRNESPLNEPVPLNTCPVIGSEPGIETISPCFTPAPLYSVAFPAPLSDTQNGLAALNEIPHGLIRSASVALDTKICLEVAGDCSGKQRCSRKAGPYSHRSEEHTSELQSPCNIVCRLLLEDKKSGQDESSADTVPGLVMPHMGSTTAP